MDAQHASGLGSVLLQRTFYKKHQFLLESARLLQPIATEGSVVQLAKPQLINRAIVAGGKYLQRHCKCIEEEIDSRPGFCHKEEHGGNAQAQIQGADSDLYQHGQRYERLHSLEESARKGIFESISNKIL